jgi:intracellular multiplication protein IcmL
MEFFKKEKDVTMNNAAQLADENIVEVEDGEPGNDNSRGIRVVVESKEYYQQAYFFAIRVASVALIVTVLSLLGNFYQYTHQPEPKYFASTPDLRLAPMAALDQPIMSQGALLDWTVESVSETLSLDFRNYKKQLTNVRDRYTRKAFKQVLDSLKSSGNLRLIADKRLSATCIATSAPIITKAGNLRGKYTWIIEFPMVVTYEDSTGVQNEQILHTKVIVERTKTTVNPKGILIKQLVTRVS